MLLLVVLALAGFLVLGVLHLGLLLLVSCRLPLGFSLSLSPDLQLGESSSEVSSFLGSLSSSPSSEASSEWCSSSPDSSEEDCLFFSLASLLFLGEHLLHLTRALALP